MKRNAFLMRVKPGREDEYRRRHDAIWPELKRELRAAGIFDYSIFLDRRTGSLFASQKLTDDTTQATLPDHPVMRKWWDHMAELMEVNPDKSPVCLPLEEVFHMD
jgi:L-rhamnose mutarotase